MLAVEAEREPFSVVAVEERSDTRIGPWHLRCRIDRIDRLATGATVLIDYKTGETAGDGWFDARLGDCQLPAYALAGEVAGIATIRLAEARIEYRGAGLGQAGLPGPYRRFEDGEWAEQIDRWRRQIEDLLAEFARGDTRIPAAARGFVRSASRAHAGGAYAALTRVGELE